MTSSSNIQTETNEPEEKSFFGIIIHSFFVIPFIIAMAALLLFASMHWLTREQLTAYDYLEQVKIGGITKRWQAAFELSKILANPKLIPQEERFANELTAAFQNSKTDDKRVQQYLALAMAKTGNPVFLNTLVSGLNGASDENLRTIIYALGLLKDKRAVPTLLQYLDNPDERVRSITVVSLGNIGDDNIRPALRRMLEDPQPNVQWGAAISLANFKDPAGKNILKNLLNRNYLSQYKEVDPQEQTQIVLEAITASSYLNDAQLNKQLQELSKHDESMRVRSLSMAALQK
ncbi:MAG: HEAT repeat domain-containing protein [Candidatus Omnitrophica bacterium]|nr:HEAT repeat domain-containing protein [Candidatus Omnitrophota bacterium]